VLSLAQQGFPVVLVDNALERTAIDSVLCDNREGALSAVEHLLWHGYTRVAFVGGPTSWLSTRRRGEGYIEVMRERGLETILVHEDETTILTGLRAGRELLDMDEPPQAVFAVNDAMALGVIRAAREAGLRVPQDLAVVGFDDISMAESAHPPLTTVRIAKEMMGEVAARRLLDLIEMERRARMAEMPVKSVIGTTLVIRASCGCSETD
jgi:LacI family transcriptional regulator